MPRSRTKRTVRGRRHHRRSPPRSSRSAVASAQRGACHGSRQHDGRSRRSCWCTARGPTRRAGTRVTEQLQADGYTVDVAPNPLRGLAEDSALPAGLPRQHPGPIVLVGHSYGGAVITDAATGNANVKALVYDDAYIPAHGENVAALSRRSSALAPAVNDPASVFKLVPYPDAPPRASRTHTCSPAFISGLAGDLPSARRPQALLAATQSPTSLLALGEPSSAPAWKTIPSWDMVGTQDRIIPRGRAADDGAPRRLPHHQDQLLARVADLAPRRRHQGHPAGGPRRRLTHPGGGAPTGGAPRHPADGGIDVAQTASAANGPLEFAQLSRLSSASERDHTMANIDPLLDRNRHFATTDAREGISFLARNQVYVITCIDPRTDPSAFLELALGDAMVARNPGGRISPRVLEDLAYIGYLNQSANPDGAKFEIAVIHHTQCGTHYLADPDFRRGFAERIDGDDATLAAEAVVNPEITVRVDVEKVRSSSILPATLTVSGHVYDVLTGLVTTIIPAAPMHSATGRSRTRHKRVPVPGTGRCRTAPHRPVPDREEPSSHTFECHTPDRQERPPCHQPRSTRSSSSTDCGSTPPPGSPGWTCSKSRDTPCRRPAGPVTRPPSPRPARTPKR